MSFTHLGLNEALLSAITELGFEKPMPIQEQAIPVLLEDQHDFIGLAQTGTGKTAAFGLALLQRINIEHCHPQGMIICPTRELCLQVTEDLKRFARYQDGLRIVSVYGGANITQQIKQLKKGAHIIVATPGRLLDLTRRKAVRPESVSCVVLDEADEMLNMGFKEDIDTLLDSLPEQRRIWLFSATMEKGVADIAHTYLSDPQEITVGNKNQSAANINHSYCMVKEKNRYPALKRLLDYAPDIYGIIFCRTRKETQTVAEHLLQDGYQAEALHGDLSQSQRDYVMRKFRQQSVRMLVATDVAARGLDVDNLSHIIHYRVPEEPAIYTHRSGRTARAGKSGLSIALLNTKELRRIREIERQNHIQFEVQQIPDGQAICEKQLFALVQRVVNADVNKQDIEPYLPAIFEAFSGIPKNDLIQRFISVEFNRFLNYYRSAQDINTAPSADKPSKNHGKQKKSRGQHKHGNEPSVRFRVNAGKRDNVNKGAILRLLCDETGITSPMIGRIDIRQKKTIFSATEEAATHIRKVTKGLKLDGQPVTVREAPTDNPHPRNRRRRSR